jgi:hypothetical protein
MAILDDDMKRLVELTTLYEQGKFSECIKLGERTLRKHAGMAPYCQIETYCILARSNREDWEKAEVNLSRPRSKERQKDVLTQDPRNGDNWAKPSIIGLSRKSREMDTTDCDS